MDALEFELQAFVCHPMWLLKAKLQVLCKQYALLTPEPSLQPLNLLFSTKVFPLLLLVCLSHLVLTGRVKLQQVCDARSSLENILSLVDWGAFAVILHGPSWTHDSRSSSGVFLDCTIHLATQMFIAGNQYGRLEVPKEKIRNSQSHVAQDKKHPLFCCYTHIAFLGSLPSTGIFFFWAFPDWLIYWQIF